MYREKNLEMKKKLGNESLKRRKENQCILKPVRFGAF